MKRYKKLNELPRGDASGRLTHGCLVVEGGGFRGMYVQGVLDSLMMHDLNFDCYIGVSSGAMNGVNYLSGQIGRGIYLGLKHRPESRFVGFRAILENKGITGFKYMWTEVQKDWPLNELRYNDPERRFVCVATNMLTGKHEYFEKGKDPDFLFAMQAGASVPFGSHPVKLRGVPYLDGGISRHVPVEWAIKEGYEKIVVVRTREKSYKATKEFSDIVVNGIYKRRFPKAAKKLSLNSFYYNKEIDRMNRLEKQGRIFMLAPSKAVELSLFCDDVDELAQLYYMGLNETNDSIEALKKYLEE